MSIFSQLWLLQEQVGQPQEGKLQLPLPSGATAVPGVRLKSWPSLLGTGRHWL